MRGLGRRHQPAAHGDERALVAKIRPEWLGPVTPNRGVIVIAFRRRPVYAKCR